MASKQPIRCFEGDAKPHEPFWRFVGKADSESGQAELELYGVLSEYSWYGDEITPAKFKRDLYKAGGGGPVLIKVNSPGGDVIAASVMRAILSEYPGEVTARVDGLAASAAVAVTIAAKNVTIMDSAYMMIHDPAVVVFLAALDIETLGKLHDQLEDIKGGLVQAYENKTQLGATRIAHMMSAETWMNAQQAVEYGFADQVISGGQKAKSLAGNVGFVNCLNGYGNVPEKVLNQFMSIPEAPVSSEPVLTEDMQRDAQKLRERVETILKKE